MRPRKYRRLRADVETQHRVAEAMEKIVEALRPLSDTKAVRVLACAAILLGHGNILGLSHPIASAERRK